MARSDPTTTRTGLVTYNRWFERRGMPWELRCYGQGKCTVANGKPPYFSDEARARQLMTAWIATGVSPADFAASQIEHELLAENARVNGYTRECVL